MESNATISDFPLNSIMSHDSPLSIFLCVSISALLFRATFHLMILMVARCLFDLCHITRCSLFLDIFDRNAIDAHEHKYVYLCIDANSLLIIFKNGTQRHFVQKKKTCEFLLLSFKPNTDGKCVEYRSAHSSTSLFYVRKCYHLE